MAVSTRELKMAEAQGRIGYLYGHPRDCAGYDAIRLPYYQRGWDKAQREKPGVPLQRRFQSQPEGKGR